MPGLHAIDALARAYHLRSANRQSIGEAAGSVTLLHVTYGSKGESAVKTLDYSSASIAARWSAGRRDMRAALDALGAARSEGQTAFQVYRYSAARQEFAPVNTSTSVGA